MSSQLEVPDDDVLHDLAVDVVRHDEPWVATLRSVAEDGSVLALTWDQVAASVTVKVFRQDELVVRIEREAMESVRVAGSSSGLHFEATMSAAHVGSTLNVKVGSTVVIDDVLLRR